MKTQLTLGLVSALAIAAVQGKGLYYVPNDTEESIPLKWSVGIDAIWDSNTTPGAAGFNNDETFSLNPYVGLSFVSITPQTTWDVYARLGVIYYLDEPKAAGSDDAYGQARLGVNLSHSFNERLRFTSRNYMAYELEPDYSYGVATTRQIGEYLFYSTDNSLGYRWSERFATISGIQLTQLDYDQVANADRFTWTLYNQFRYQLSPQSVLTASYRYSETSGNGIASDSTNQYLLAGIEHRFSPNTIAIVNVGAQIRDVSGTNGDNNVNPYVEVNLRTQVNTQFNVSSFLRYGVEDYDTVFGGVQFDEKVTLRLGIAGSYVISPSLSLYGGVDLVTASNESGRTVPGGVPIALEPEETLINAYIGASLKLTEIITATLTYNFTDSDADAPIFGRNYDRSRISLGLSAEF